MRFSRKLEIFFLLALIIVSFAVRFYKHYYPSLEVDPVWDFVIVRDIVNFDNPLVFLGPNGQGLGGLRMHSALYYYLLAPFSFVNREYVFLNMAPILFQTLNMVIIYFLGKELFGYKVGILGSLVYSFSSANLARNPYLFQPNLMEPLFNLSLLLIILAVKKKHFGLAVWSISAFLFAGAMHLSALIALPLSGWLWVKSLRKIGLNRRRVFYLVLGIVASITLFFGPQIAFLWQYRGLLDHISLNFTANINTFFVSLGQYFTRILDGTTFDNFPPIYQAAGTVFMVILLLTYFLSAKKGGRKNTLLLLAIIIQSILLLSISNLPFRIHYLLFIQGILFLVLAKMLINFFEVFSFKKIRVLAAAMAVLVFLLISSRGFTSVARDKNVIARSKDTQSLIEKLASQNLSDFKIRRVSAQETSIPGKPEVVIASDIVTLFLLEKPLSRKILMANTHGTVIWEEGNNLLIITCEYSADPQDCRQNAEAITRGYLFENKIVVGGSSALIFRKEGLSV